MSIWCKFLLVMECGTRVLLANFNGMSWSLSFGPGDGWAKPGLPKSSVAPVGSFLHLWDLEFKILLKIRLPAVWMIFTRRDILGISAFVLAICDPGQRLD